MYLINSRPLFPDGPDCVGSPAVTGNDLLHPFGQPTVPQPDADDRPNPCDRTTTRPDVLGDMVAIHATTSDSKIEMVSCATELTSWRLSVIAAARSEGRSCPARNVGTRCGDRCSTWRRRPGPQSNRADC